MEDPREWLSSAHKLKIVLADLRLVDLQLGSS